jgi:hypothetical protein
LPKRNARTSGVRRLLAEHEIIAAYRRKDAAIADVLPVRRPRFGVFEAVMDCLVASIAKAVRAYVRAERLGA